MPPLPPANRITGHADCGPQGPISITYIWIVGWNDIDAIYRADIVRQLDDQGMAIGCREREMTGDRGQREQGRQSADAGRFEAKVKVLGGGPEMLAVEAFDPADVRPWKFHNRARSGMDEVLLEALAASIRRDGQQ